jgi:hypothetical protein
MMEENEIEKHIDDPETDTESIDPFPDCRLSEVVAHMLDSDDDEDDPFEDHYEIQTAFIDYNEEPKNKELFRGPLPSIEESELEDAFACDNDECGDKVVNENEITRYNQIAKIYKSPSQQEHLSDNLQSKINDNEHHIKTIIGTRTETIFGVSVASANKESEGRIISRSETEFGAESEFKDVRYRWSVTSV